MFKLLLSAIGLAPKKPLLCKRWISSSPNDQFSEEFATTQIHSVLSAGANPFSATSVLTGAVHRHLASGAGLILIDSPDSPWLPSLTKIIQELDRDADLEVVHPDELGIYPAGLSKLREQQRILVVMPPGRPIVNAPMRERTISNLLVELMFDSSQPGFGHNSLVIVNDMTYGMRESLLSSLIRQSSGATFQVVIHIPDLIQAEKHNPKLLQHLAANADVCVSRKKRSFTTDKVVAGPRLADSIRIELT